MTEEQFEATAIAYLKNELGSEARKEFEALIATNLEMQQQLQEMEGVLSLAKTEALEQPDPAVSENFYAMLSREKSIETVKVSWMQRLEKGLENFMALRRIRQAALLLSTALISGFLGFQLNSGSAVSNASSVEADLEQMKQVVASLQLKSYSATDRIQGMSYLQSSNMEEETVVAGFMAKLLFDDNLHVRINAGQSLLEYGHRPEVKSAFVDAIRKEKEVIVSAMLINGLLQMDERLAEKEINRLLESDSTSWELRRVLDDLLTTKKG